MIKTFSTIWALSFVIVGSLAIACDGIITVQNMAGTVCASTIFATFFTIVINENRKNAPRPSSWGTIEER